MTDLYDRATEVEEAQREDALAAQQRRAHLGEPRDWRTLSARRCVACGTPIPEARRKALPGVDECVDCASLRQQRERSR